MKNFSMIGLAVLSGIVINIQYKSDADGWQDKITVMENSCSCAEAEDGGGKGVVQRIAQNSQSGNRDGQCKGKPDFSPCALSGALYKYNICIDEECIMPGCGSVECNPPGPHFRIAGEVEPSHFRIISAVANEPVVADALTGLVWQGCAAGLSGSGCTEGQAIKKTWSEALYYCDSLYWGGLTGWRLPDAHELVSIVDYGRAEPATDTYAFQNTPSSSWFWSSTSRKNVIESAWSVFIDFGNVNFYYQSYNFNVRCVRDEMSHERGPSSSIDKINADPRRSALKASTFLPRFDRTFPGAGCEPVVKDNVTGLIWQGCPAGFSGKDCLKGNAIRKSWDEARLYCTGLNWGGRLSGWRLPNAMELSSLIDFRRENPAIDTSVFKNTAGDFYWSLSLYVNNGYSWFEGFNYGIVSYLAKKNIGNIRCVRDRI